jgi:hypothetical protein
MGERKTRVEDLRFHPHNMVEMTGQVLTIAAFEYSHSNLSRGNCLFLLVMFSLNKPHSPHFITIR